MTLPGKKELRRCFCGREPWVACMWCDSPVAEMENESLVPFKITDELQFGNLRFVLREPIEVRVDFREGLWLHEAPEFSIIGYGPTRQASLNSFCMDFAALWEHIAQEQDANLTEGAQALKKKFHETVASVNRA